MNGVKFVVDVQIKRSSGRHMGITERREREREALRQRIVEAARDLLSEQGLAALSMRSIAERIEYSPATIYLYFRDKDELVGQVVHAGFERLRDYTTEELTRLSETADAADQYAATGRAYVRFALDNCAYFRVMFELPGSARIDCPAVTDGAADPDAFERVVARLEEARRAGLLTVPDVRRAAVIGWGLVHGLTSLYLSGHLHEEMESNEEFMALIEEAMHSMYRGWGAGQEAVVRPAGRRSAVHKTGSVRAEAGRK
jgi:AcrR family transcriptional regulator